MGSHIENIRLSFRPDRIRVLFVGESPPANGTFFYKCDSNLCHYTQEAFSSTFDMEFLDAAHFLKFFGDQGCYLDDLSLTSVNIMDKPTRRRARENGVRLLANRIRTYEPETVIVVMRAIARYVKESIGIAGLNLVPVYSLPFPSMGNQRKYVVKLTEVLRELRAQGNF